MFSDSDDKSCKMFWKFIHSKQQEPSGISSLKSNSKIIFDSKGKANCFNNQFSSVFTTEDISTLPNLGESTVPPMEDIKITCSGVLKLLQDLNTRKATGPESISAHVLKTYATEIAPVLTFIFQQSISSGYVPTDWRLANITPIFKKGDKSTPSNYSRPVSITSICSKLIEDIIFSNVMDHYENNNVLVDVQHGFRPGRSCETQLLITAQDLSKSLDNKEQVDAVVLDFSKAFDRVPHSRLMLKFQHYGINGCLLDWINNFLTNRSQRVVVDGQSSEWVPVQSGVPQGTVLGPLLFLTFINDIPHGISSHLRLFADDCLMYRTISNASDSTKLQEDLDRLHQWSQTWQMQFNTDKCYIMHFTLRRNITFADYNLGGRTLSTVTDYPYLGLSFSNNLSWQKHISNITSRANRMLGLVRRNLRKCSTRIRQQAFVSLVRPHLEYCCPVWNPHTNKDITRIEAIQRRAARFVLQQYHRTDSVSAMLNTLEWDTLEKRRQAASLVLMYKMRNNIIAVNPDEYLSPALPSNTRSYHPNKYQLIPARTQLYANSFIPRTVKWWNALPGNILVSPSVEAFKGAVAGSI